MVPTLISARSQYLKYYTVNVRILNRWTSCWSVLKAYSDVEQFLFHKVNSTTFKTFHLKHSGNSKICHYWLRLAKGLIRNTITKSKPQRSFYLFFYDLTKKKETENLRKQSAGKTFHVNLIWHSITNEAWVFLITAFPSSKTEFQIGKHNDHKYICSWVLKRGILPLNTNIFIIKMES